jgi:hypothetical protein
VAFAGESSTLKARTVATARGAKSPLAVACLVPILLSGLLFAGTTAASAWRGQTGPSQGQADALTARIASGASRIHQLTTQLDQARLHVQSTSAQLGDALRQHDQTVVALAANHAILRDQAVVAYMRGGPASGLYARATAGDVTLGRAYLEVATGNLTDAGDQLKVLESNLRRQQAALDRARKASSQAVSQAQQAREAALATAGQEQAQLDAIQKQLTAQAVLARATTLTPPAPAPSAPQGLPVNGGLVAVVTASAGPAITAQASLALPTPTTPITPPTTSVTPAAGGGHAGGVWLQLRQCESGDNYGENSGNGYYGAYQFSQPTWTGLGYPGRPDQESPAMQDKAAMQLQAQSGWGQWPACAAALGLA